MTIAAVIYAIACWVVMTILIRRQGPVSFNVEYCLATIVIAMAPLLLPTMAIFGAIGGVLYLIGRLLLANITSEVKR